MASDSDGRADKNKLLNFVTSDFADRVKCRPRDDKLFSFFLFMINNPDRIWNVISSSFAARHPLVDVNTAEIEIDELCHLIGSLPLVPRSYVEKFHRENEAKKLRKITKEIKVLSFILSPEEYKPSMIEKVALEKPRKKCRNLYCGLLCTYSDPHKRIALKAITQYYSATPRLWVTTYKKKNIFF